MEDVCTEERFLRNVSKHKMTIFRDDGVNRHIRFKQSDTGAMYFDLITWPGHLCYTGDMGTFVFQWFEDMFEFFRTDRKPPSNGQKLFINTGYWAEKCIAVDSVDGIRKYSPDLFREIIKEWLEEALEGRKSDCEDDDKFEENKVALTVAVEDDILQYADEGEQSAREAADNFEFVWNGKKITISDFWERTLTEKSFRFVWCCYAVSWGIEQYDQSQAEPVSRGIHPLSNLIVTLTCGYCGMAYPEGTPPHGSQVLTDHIKVCEKHPLRKAEADIAKLRRALIGLVGAENIKELQAIEFVQRTLPAPDADKVLSINAIHALLETV